MKLTKFGAATLLVALTSIEAKVRSFHSSVKEKRLADEESKDRHHLPTSTTTTVDHGLRRTRHKPVEQGCVPLDAPDTSTKGKSGPTKGKGSTASPTITATPTKYKSSKGKGSTTSPTTTATPTTNKGSKGKGSTTSPTTTATPTTSKGSKGKGSTASPTYFCTTPPSQSASPTSTLQPTRTLQPTSAPTPLHRCPITVQPISTFTPGRTVVDPNFGPTTCGDNPPSINTGVVIFDNFLTLSIPQVCVEVTVTNSECFDRAFISTQLTTGSSGPVAPGETVKFSYIPAVDGLEILTFWTVSAGPCNIAYSVYDTVNDNCLSPLPPEP